MKSSPRIATIGACLLLAFPLAAAACSSDTKDSVGEAANNVGSDVSNAADNAGSAVDDAVTEDTADEGSAKNNATAMAAALGAMPGGGEATVANLNEAAKLVPAPGKVTGIEDSDGDSMDDDAKATVETNNGDDKACVQSQNGKWEATDDEC